jgi:pimeloyl-ACP methyl ester carboxylesterase
MKNTIKQLFLMLMIVSTSKSTFSQGKMESLSISNAVYYELIGRYDLERLNHILNVEIPTATGIKENYTPAKNAVKLYRITYPSVIPEQNNRPTLASGLIAIPEVVDNNLPVISYQHGTVMEKDQVPSFPEKSFETRLMIAQFAAQGYVVFGADYFGMGTSKEKDGYMVLGSQQQACIDMYEVTKLILPEIGINPTAFFLTGWSQGGVVTMSFLERLERSNTKVTGVGTAAAQCDGYVMTNGFLNFPRKIDASWVTAMFMLTLFSYEEYYQIPGLAQGFFTPEMYEIAKRVYEKDPTLNPEEFPVDLKKLIRKEFFDPVYYRNSAYGKLISEMHPYRWVIESQVRMYYGEIDESLTVGLARLPMVYQTAMGNNKVEAFSLGAEANHRITFAKAVPQWKKWFDQLVDESKKTIKK